MRKFKFKKGMSISFILIPMIMLTIALWTFYTSYTAKNANNMKKVLQEAAYTGSLAGALALDITSFEKGIEPYANSFIYPTDGVTNTPVIFMKQETKYIRKGELISNQDILTLKGIKNPTTSISNANDVAAREIVNAVEEYLVEKLKDIRHNTGTNTYEYTYVENVGGKFKLKSDVYSISMYFERDNLKYVDLNGNSVANARDEAPFNKVTVTVSLKYKPIMYAKAFMSKADKNNGVEESSFRIPIYGTSSARTKTII